VYSHQSQDKVHLENLVVSIYQDDYFEPLLSNVVRETVDGEKETLEQLLNRVLDDFKKPSISWLQFLGHFSKRGRLQGYNDIDISPSKEKVQFLTMAEQGLSQIDAQKQQELKEENLKKLKGLIKNRLEHKEDLVPKEGKGKFNITVPVEFEFLQRQKVKTIREQKLEQMIKEANDKEEYWKQYKILINEIPRSTKMPLF
jgi:hypothetical protein